MIRKLWLSVELILSVVLGLRGLARARNAPRYVLCLIILAIVLGFGGFSLSSKPSYDYQAWVKDV